MHGLAGEHSERQPSGAKQGRRDQGVTRVSSDNALFPLDPFFPTFPTRLQVRSASPTQQPRIHTRIGGAAHRKTRRRDGRDGRETARYLPRRSISRSSQSESADIRRRGDVLYSHLSRPSRHRAFRSSSSPPRQNGPASLLASTLITASPQPRSGARTQSGARLGRCMSRRRTSTHRRPPSRSIGRTRRFRHRLLPRARRHGD